MTKNHVVANNGYIPNGIIIAGYYTTASKISPGSPTTKTVWITLLISP